MTGAELALIWGWVMGALTAGAFALACHGRII